MKGLRQIKNKIRGIENLRKIAQAMALVSSNKMRKAQKYALSSRPITNAILSLIKDFSSADHFLIKENKAKKDLLIIVAADRGLAGSLNSNVFKVAVDFIKNYNRELHLILIGKKAVNFFQRPQFSKYKIVAKFEKFGDYFLPEQTLPLTDFLIEAFKKEIYKDVYIIYTHFIKTLEQKVVLRKILPLKLTDLFEIFKPTEEKLDYIIEPNKKIFQEKVIPIIFRILVHHLILEANASEHSARMVAMKKAADNAKEMLESLYLTYNKIRQEKITEEILDITRK
jgi:F-type H+-transporting ATPase subunit gamma